jgi:predicted DNA-binding protein
VQHVHLSPNVERRLVELAKRTGRSASELLEEGIENLEVRYPASASQDMRQAEVTTEQTREGRGSARARVWLDAIKTFPHSPPLSDMAISRETMYGARGWWRR